MMREYNHGLFQEILKRFDGPPLHDGTSPVNTTYNAVVQEWPQINYKTTISYVATSFLRVAWTENTDVGKQPHYIRRPGLKAWLWRLWYEIMVRPNGPDDTVLKKRGWFYSLLTVQTHYDTIEFKSFGIDYSDFWGMQRDKRHMPYITLAYYPRTDTLYIREDRYR